MKKEYFMPDLQFLNPEVLVMPELCSLLVPHCLHVHFLDGPICLVSRPHFLRIENTVDRD